ncbi:MAG: D-alanyl-D-alanine carboxypeptidase family protein [Candidatus Dormibacteria bacterium]
MVEGKQETFDTGTSHRAGDLVSRIAIGIVAILACGVGITGQRELAAPLPRVHAVARAAVTINLPGVSQSIPVATTGGEDVVLSDGRSLLSSHVHTPFPTGSVAKVMTAYLVLTAHPLTATSQGPTLVMTSRDVGFYTSTVREDGSNVPVQLGEHLTERQLLLGLMLPSANNLALTLGVWVSGSEAQFVQLMNATAARLGMVDTHFADPSGYSPNTISSAADLVILGTHAMALPSFRSVVSTVSTPFPVVGTLTNLDEYLGVIPGWNGVKTGWTGAAGGCLMFSATRYVEGHAETVVGAVLGQKPDAAAYPSQPELGTAFLLAKEAVVGIFQEMRTVSLSTITKQLQPQAVVPWETVPLAAAGSSRVLVGIAGDTITVHLKDTPHVVPATTTVPVGELSVQDGTEQLDNVPLVPVRTVSRPSVWWKLFHG